MDISSLRADGVQVFLSPDDEQAKTGKPSPAYDQAVGFTKAWIMPVPLAAAPTDTITYWFLDSHDTQIPFKQKSIPVSVAGRTNFFRQPTYPAWNPKTLWGVNAPRITGTRYGVPQDVTRMVATDAQAKDMASEISKALGVSLLGPFVDPSVSIDPSPEVTAAGLKALMIAFPNGDGAYVGELLYQRDRQGVGVPGTWTRPSQNDWSLYFQTAIPQVSGNEPDALPVPMDPAKVGANKLVHDLFAGWILQPISAPTPNPVNADQLAGLQAQIDKIMALLMMLLKNAGVTVPA